jgi:hypothetical protein
MAFRCHKEINMQAQSDVPDVVSGNHDDVEYDAFLARVQARFSANIGAASPLFTTDAEGMWTAYLDSFSPEQRQYHNCHSCRQFIERFGALVTIDDAGMTASAVWNENDAPELYRPAVRAMERLARRGRVTGVFLSADAVWGSPVTGIWRHFAVTPPKAMIYNRRAILTAEQAMAEKREDYGIVQRALAEFSQPMVEQALTLLQTESLYRSEKVLGPAQWLRDLHVARGAAKGTARDNVTWKAVATAPTGFCHPRSSMVGTLLEDIAAGLDFSEVSRRFAEKMHPLQYQRPQAAPSVGNIAQSEKLVEKMGIAASLRRRFARLDEVEALWMPAPTQDEPKGGGGVFSHLQPKSAAPPMGGTDMPAVTMTWDKFQRTVLPEALEIEFFAPHGSDNYTALVTAVDPDAPPILQWDREEQRNPVSWYVWHGGSSAAQWGLSGGRFHKVSAVTLKPSMWHGGNDHQGAGVVFILDGAKESRFAGLALFPETLRAELREIRPTIEAFSRNGQIEGVEEASACGIALMKGNNWNARFRVRSATSTVEYKLDRWD